MKFQKFSQWLEGKTILVGGGDLGHASNPAKRRNAQLVMTPQNDGSEEDMKVLQAFKFTLGREGGISNPNVLQAVKGMYQHASQATPHLMGKIREMISAAQKAAAPAPAPAPAPASGIAPFTVTDDDMAAHYGKEMDKRDAMVKAKLRGR